MIISHTHRYVFVEMPRTGSRAVATELINYYDGQEILRRHATYSDFERHATDTEKTYFSFSAVRNPLDVAVTRYAHLLANAKGRFTTQNEISLRNSMSSRIERRIYRWIKRRDASFEEFLLRWYVLPYDTWTSLDHRRLDFVMRSESLTSDFALALEKMGIDAARPLPVVNATPGKASDFEAYFTPRARRRAAWVFGPYMREWGYRFPESWGAVKVPAWSRVLLKVIRPFRMLYWKYLRFADYVRKRPGGALTIPRG